jgi:thioredoxin-related protein
MRLLYSALSALVFQSFFATPVRCDESLPWEKDYAAAQATAKAEKRPLFLMLTATWCGPCKMLEARTLPEPSIREGLKEFVWVKAYEDEKLNQRFGLGGYPTLVFLDCQGERVLTKSTGYEPAGSFLRVVLEARKAANLPLTDRMKELEVKSFVPSWEKLQELTKAGDVEALLKYLEPAKDDQMRDNNYLVVKLHLPPEMSKTARSELIVLAAGEQPVPDSGVLLIPIPRDQREATLTVLSPGFGFLKQTLELPPETAVLAQGVMLKPLPKSEAASFSGRVVLPSGKPVANAIVRLCDWSMTRTDQEGRFKFENVAPTELTVRAEAPGGEFQDSLTFAPGKEVSRDLELASVTTVGIRWALQTREGVRDLVGEGVRTGQAYFSVKHSRFLLERGAEVRVYWGSDFMLMDDWKSIRQYADKGKAAELEAAPAGTPFFWLFDACDRTTGLHAEQAQFNDIKAVNDGKPYDDKAYFKFLRGDVLRRGQVYTLRSVRKDCYAKLEITDVTLAPCTVDK